MSDSREPKLWFVTVEFSGSIEGLVWAQGSNAARQIAEAEFDQTDADIQPDGSPTVYEVTPESAEKLDLHGLDHTYGIPPEECEDGVEEALQYLKRDAEMLASYRAARDQNLALFDDIDPRPLPCEECGERFPERSHARDCPLDPDREENGPQTTGV